VLESYLDPVPRPIACAAAFLLVAARVEAQCPNGSPPPCAAARPTAREARPLDPNRIAILPFRITTTDTLLGEGFAELLATEFTGEGGPRSVDMATVLSAWRAAGGGLRSPLSQARAIAVARGLGAATVTEGSIVGLGRNITVTVTLVGVQDGTPRGVPAKVTVPADSLDSALRQAAAILLGSLGGQQRAFLGARFTDSPAAMRAYLIGLAAWRRGRLSEARVALDQAIATDSSFAQAIFRRYLAGLWSTGTAPYARLAWDARARLAPQERIVLEGVMGSSYPEPRAIERRHQDRERAAALLPDSPDAQYLMGDYWFHYGSPTNPTVQLERARDYFLRATSVDSQATVLRHLIEVGIRLRDTALLRQVVPRYLGTDDAGMWSGAWVAAASIGDTSLIARLRRRPADGSGPENFWGMAAAIVADVPASLLDELLNRWESAFRRDQRRDGFWQLRGFVLTLRGRPAAAESAWAQVSAAGRPDVDESVLLHAMVGGLGHDVGQSLAAVEARASDTAANRGNLCLASMLRQQRGEADRVGERSSATCRDLLELVRNPRDTSAARTARLEGLDSLVRNSLQTMRGFEALRLARLWEGNGKPARALSAIRYRTLGFGMAEAPMTLPEEGRLAEIVGDTVGAVRVYKYWLEITRDAEPIYTPRRDSVRAALNRLTRKVVP
jgi:tetratricopeptide (TPR) repeat protein